MTHSLVTCDPSLRSGGFSGKSSVGMGIPSMMSLPEARTAANTSKALDKNIIYNVTRVSPYHGNAISASGRLR